MGHGTFDCRDAGNHFGRNVIIRCHLCFLRESEVLRSFLFVCSYYLSRFYSHAYFVFLAFAFVRVVVI